jgi:hypothetical protein
MGFVDFTCPPSSHYIQFLWILERAEASSATSRPRN